MASFDTIYQMSPSSPDLNIHSSCSCSVEATRPGMLMQAHKTIIMENILRFSHVILVKRMEISKIATKEILLYVLSKDDKKYPKII